MKTTEELKEIYEANPDEWIALWSTPKGWRNNGVWFETSNPNFIDEYHYKLISVKHRDVLGAWLEDSSVEIERLDIFGASNRLWVQTNAFIETYNPDLEYRLKEKEDGIESIGDSSNSDTDSYKINNFEEYGFTADFEGEILKEVDGRYIGWLRNNLGTTFSSQWYKNGTIMPQAYSTKSYNLTPIKKEWYEYEENFPALVYDSENTLALAVSTTDGRLYSSYDNVIDMAHGCRLATKAERDSLYIKEEK